MILYAELQEKVVNSMFSGCLNEIRRRLPPHEEDMPRIYFIHPLCKVFWGGLGSPSAVPGPIPTWVTLNRTE